MTLRYRPATAVIFAGLAVGSAGTAWAESATMSGHYIETSTDSGGESTTEDWYVTPCGDGCAWILTSKVPPRQALVINGQWTMDETQGVGCPDGTQVPNAYSIHTTWDPNTLAGTSTLTFNVAACGDPVGSTGIDTIHLTQAP